MHTVIERRIFKLLIFVQSNLNLKCLYLDQIHVIKIFRYTLIYISIRACLYACAITACRVQTEFVEVTLVVQSIIYGLLFSISYFLKMSLKAVCVMNSNTASPVAGVIKFTQEVPVHLSLWRFCAFFCLDWLSSQACRLWPFADMFRQFIRCR